MRLDLNENPVGLPQEFIDSVLSTITPTLIAQYPETMPFTELLADYLKANIENICLTNGSAEAIRYVIEGFTAPGGKVVGVVPSYFMFQVYSEMYGRNFVGVSYNDDLTMDIKNIIDEMTEDTQLLILLNPNNPMGNTYSEEEFMHIMEVAKNLEITVLIDEAYYYFYPNTFIEYALKNKHVFVTRTCSKLFSMAGCRLGYIVGWSEGVKIVQKLCTPHNVNVFALKFAEAILMNSSLLESLIIKFNSGRQYLLESLEENGYKYTGNAGNFLFIKTKTDANTIVQRMKNEKSILIKSYDNVGEFGTCLRVSIGERFVMVKFISALLDLDR